MLSLISIYYLKFFHFLNIIFKLNKFLLEKKKLIFLKMKQFFILKIK